MPPDMKAFNRAIIEEFRANGGRLGGPMANSRLILLTTIGARSGEPRTTVIGYRPLGDELADGIDVMYAGRLMEREIPIVIFERI